MALDWVLRAQRYEYGLSPQQHLYAVSSLHARPRPLELDIHDGMEFGLVLEGIEERHYQGYVVTCRPGDVWMSATWEPHGWRVVAPRTRNVCLVFHPDFLGDEMLGPHSWLTLFAAPPEDRPRVTGPEMRAQVLALGRSLRHEVETRTPGWYSATRLDLLRLLLTLSRRWQPPDSAPGLGRGRPHHLARVMPALALVHAQLARRVSAAEAAGACGLSRAQFNRLFPHTMGMSFARFCLRARLAFAAHSLLSTGLSVQGIAQQAGFVDASHFHRAFLRVYDCTPGQYRKLALG